MHRTALFVWLIAIMSGTAFGALPLLEGKELAQLFQALESELSSGELTYSYECVRGEKFGAYIRGKFLTRHESPIFYSGQNLDSLLNCKMVYSGSDYRLDFTENPKIGGGYNVLGVFENSNSIMASRSISDVRHNGLAVLMLPQEGAITIRNRREDSSAAPLVHNLFTKIPTAVLGYKMKDIEANLTYKISDLLSMAGKPYHKFTMKQNGKDIELEFELPSNSETPEIGTRYCGKVVLDSEKGWLPTMSEWTIRWRNGHPTGVTCRTKWGDYKKSENSSRMIPCSIDLDLEIIPNLYFGEEYRDELGKLGLDTSQSKPETIFSHKFRIKDFKFPVSVEEIKKAFKIDLEPGTKIEDKILGKSYIFNGDLVNLEKTLHQQK